MPLFVNVVFEGSVAGKMSLGDVHRFRKGGARQRISPSKASKVLSNNLTAYNFT
jgi:hypothetical protein